MGEPTRRRRTLLSLSLRGVLVLILAVSVPAGWMARRAHRQRRAVAAIEALHGGVVYDWQILDRPVDVPPNPALNRPPGPAWLRKLLGDEYFQEVVRASIPAADPDPIRVVAPPPDAPKDGPAWQAFREGVRRNREIDEALNRDQLACLEGLDRLETLALERPSLDAEGLARLGRLTSLRILNAESLRIDSAGLAEVARLTKLERLSILLRLPDDAPLALLERMPRLQRLEISVRTDGMVMPSVGSPAVAVTPGAPVTDAWLARIGRIGSLTHLGFDDCSQVTDAGLAHLRGLVGLEYLNLGGMSGVGGAAQITDVGLAHLAGLKHLGSLFLADAANVTDAGVARLEGLRELERLHLDSASNLTDASVASLARLPALLDLNLNVHSMTDAGIARLGAFRKLRSLVLTGAGVEGEVLDGIEAANPGLILEADRIEPGTTAEVPDAPG